MSANTPPTFEPMNKLPTEIRSMIFAYMIQDLIVSHMEPPPGSSVNVLSDEFQAQGLDTGTARTHLISSPWLLNKQYCAEYLQVFVAQTELRTRFTSRWRTINTKHLERVTQLLELAELRKVLGLITHRFNIAGPYAGIETSSKLLLSRIKGICFSYHYHGSYFLRGDVNPESRRLPRNDFLTSPLRLLRYYHENYNIPSNRLSIHISYGEPSQAILKCLEHLEPGRTDSHKVSLRAMQAQIQVDDYDASVAAIDKELLVLHKAVGKITEELHVKFPAPHESYWILLFTLIINVDMLLLRYQHLSAIDQVTEFWKALDREKRNIPDRKALNRRDTWR
jgi:hypothetical protein